MLLLALTTALAQDPVPPTAEPEEILVLGDRFARWDRTRWYLHVQVGYPMPIRASARRNHDVELTAFDLRVVLDCSRTWMRAETISEVECTIEDVGLRGAIVNAHRDMAGPGQIVLDEYDNASTGAVLQLIVTADGRVTHVDIEGLDERNDRMKAIAEQIRHLYLNTMAGFHLKLPKDAAKAGNQWVEDDPTLFRLSVQRMDAFTRRWEDSRQASMMPAMSAATVVHQVNAYQGQLVVQSEGQGTALLNPSSEEFQTYVTGTLHGVALFDPETAIMTERVWAMHAQPTAGSIGALGNDAFTSWHRGQMRMLDREEKIDVGKTYVTATPGGLGEPALPPYPKLQIAP